MCFRDRAFCSAHCATADCRRRWTAELQEAADIWWNPKRDPLVTEGAPVSFMNFAPGCPDYRQPDPDQDHRELNPGETNV
jgi:hypothetical protein